MYEKKGGMILGDNDYGGVCWRRRTDAKMARQKAEGKTETQILLLVFRCLDAIRSECFGLHRDAHISTNNLWQLICAEITNMHVYMVI